MTSRDDHKRAAARAALAHVPAGTIVGVGTGSTADCFIDALAELGPAVRGAVASSEASARRLRQRGIALVALNDVDALPVYVDGADEVDPARRLIKGGGGALAREKIVAAASERFVCVVDGSKRVARLGAFPLAIEVLPFAVRFVAGRVERLGGRATVRDGFVTDNGNAILDVRGLDMEDPDELESILDRIPGAVANGLFCLRRPEIVLVGTANGVEILGPRS
jgi:ribose 5-phosphate isomerase A